MKKYLFSLICASVLGTAWGQSPAVVNPAPVAGSQVIPASTSVMMPAMTAVQAAKGSHGGQCDNCAPKTKTVCISEPTVVVRTKVVFSSDCQPFCVKCCFGKKKDCDSCQPKSDCAAGCTSGLCCGVSKDGGCGHVRMKRELYKRVIKEECPTYKCTPVEVPVCETVKCGSACALSLRSDLPHDLREWNVRGRDPARPTGANDAARHDCYPPGPPGDHGNPGRHSDGRTACGAGGADHQSGFRTVALRYIPVSLEEAVPFSTGGFLFLAAIPWLSNSRRPHFGNTDPACGSWTNELELGGKVEESCTCSAAIRH